MDLSALKRDSALLMAVLGRERPGQHIKCPFHADERGSMSVWQTADGVWFWKCHSGCGSGTIIDAAMRAYNCSSPAEAVRAIERELGVKIGRDEEYQEPRIDADRAERLVVEAHKFLMGNEDIQERMLRGKRGISDLGLVERFRLGFGIGMRFRGWQSWKLTGWVLPITDARDRLVAVKIHTEMRRDQRTRTIPKCLWAPFGTYPPPPSKPKNGTLTLWPPPEVWTKPRRLYVCPGELKAMAMLGAGLAATSPTSGEGGKLPSRLVDRLRAVTPGHVFVAYDDDPAGRKWRDALAEQISQAGLAVATLKFSLQSPVKPCQQAQEASRPIAPPPPPEAPGEALARESTPMERPAGSSEAPVATSPSEPAPAPAGARHLHRFPSEVHAAEPAEPCPTCGGTEKWDLWGGGGALVCARCVRR